MKIFVSVCCLMPVLAWAQFGTVRSFCADGSQKAGTPVLEGCVVSCLNKQVECLPHLGAVRLTADGETLLTSCVSFHEVNRRTGADSWLGNTQRGIASWRVVTNKVGNAFHFDAYRKLPECEWKHFHVEFELMPDGLVRVTEQGWPCPRTDIYDVKWESHFLEAPAAVGANTAVVTNGVLVRTATGRRWAFPQPLGTRETSVTLFAGEPARECQVLFPKGDRAGGLNVQYRENGAFSVFMSSTGAKTFYLDIRRGTPKIAGPNVRGGIDFGRVEKLDLPDVGVRNLLPNGSFESGVKGWFYRPGLTGDCWYTGKWERVYHALCTNEARFGRTSLACFADRDPEASRWEPRRLRHAVHVGSMPVMLDRGTYTVSFWAKAAHAGDIAYVWSPFFSWSDDGHTSSFATRSKAAQIRTELATEWKRYSFTFEQKKADVWNLMLNVCNPAVESTVWVDGFQLERGAVPTAFEPPLAEAELLTAEPENFLDAKSRIDARLRITARPNVSGAVRVRAKLPEGEAVADLTRPFETDAKGVAMVPIDLEDVGNGLFVLRYDFAVADKTCFLHDRLVRVPYQDGRSVKWGRLFASEYGDESYQHFAPRRFLRQRRCGICTADDVTAVKTGRDLYRKSGLEPGLVEMGRNYRKDGKLRWGIYENDEILARRSVNPGVTPGTKLLLGLFSDEGVPLDAAYLKRLKEAVRQRVLRHMDVKWWEFSSEMPYSAWSEQADSKTRAKAYAQCLKAFVEAVHETNPQALAFTQSPCNLSESGIMEIKDVLSALDALGGKVDGVSAHPYRFSPENPDLDAALSEVMDHLRKLGYPESTPLAFGEMMHWGPYELTALGLSSSTWSGPPRTWVNGALSYDLGVTERRSAAWRARSWLVGLKYASRVLCMVSGACNNWEIDIAETPRLTQLVSATLSELFGNATFQEDIRFAPTVRALVFEDERGRPVVATWCHKEGVDFEREAAPEAVASFGGDLEGVFEISGHFTPAAKLRRTADGKVRFALAGCPRYWRFRAGSLSRVREVFRKARVLTGQDVAPVRLEARPVAPDRVQLTASNFLSDDLPLTFAAGDGPSSRVTVPASGKATFDWPMPRLAEDRQTPMPLKVTATSDEGGKYVFDLSCTGRLARHVDEAKDETTIDWSAVPSYPLLNRVDSPGTGFAAKAQVVWSGKGIFFRVDVTDPVFSHVAHKEPWWRWDNDCLQVCLDPFLSARSGGAKGRDADDYEYHVCPNPEGTSARVLRFFGADQQLTVGVTKVKRDQDWCDTSRAHFERRPDGYVYTVFLSAEDVMPLRLEKGQAFGFGIQANDAVDDATPFTCRQNPRGRVVGQLNDGAHAGKSYFADWKAMPAVLLWE